MRPRRRWAQQTLLERQILLERQVLLEQQIPLEQQVLLEHQSPTLCSTSHRSRLHPAPVPSMAKGAECRRFEAS